MCKRTYFRENKNFFEVRGKSYGESYVAFEKGKIYSYRLPKDYESVVGVGLIIESEVEDIWIPIKESEVKKYFTDLKENRNNKINEILNR